MKKIEGIALRQRRAIGGGIAAATAGAVIITGALVPNMASALAGADQNDPSAAAARIVSLDTSLLGGLNVAALGDTATSSPAAPGTPDGDVGHLSVSAINDAITLDLGQLQLPLLNDGTNDGLLDLGDAGALSSYSISPSATSSTSAAGVLGAAGAIDTGAVQNNTSPAHLELTDLLGQLGLDGLTDQIIDQAGIEIGTLAARAEKNGTTLAHEYALADLELNIHSPLVGNLSSTLTTAVNDVVAPVNGVVGQDGLLSGVLGSLSSVVDAVDLTVAGTGIRLDSDPTKSTLAVTGLDTLVNGVVQDLLADQISNTNGSVVLDLSTGTIHVDLAELVIGANGLDASNLDNLSQLPANTEVLTADVISAITAGVTESLVGAGPDSLATKLHTLLNDRIWNDVGLSIGVNAVAQVCAIIVGCSDVAEAAITINGSLGEFAGKDGAALDSSNISTTLNVAGLNVGDLINGITAGLIAPITQNVTGPLLDLVTDSVLGNVQSILQTGIVEGVLAPVIGLLEPLLEQIVSLRINEQPTAAPINGEGALGADSFTVRALSLTLLPDLDAVKVDLASASVKAADAAAVPTVDAHDPVQAGTNLSVTGENWVPGSEVTLTLRDGSNAVVGTPVTVTVEDDGTLPLGTVYAIPLNTPEGTDYVLTAVDDEDPQNTATDTVAITEGDEGDVNTNAAASASASADATANGDPAAQAAAVAAALADATSAASAAANANANAAAVAAATTSASTNASTTSTSTSNAQAAAAAQAAAQADNSSTADANSVASTAANANSSVASQAAATSNASTTASSEASTNANAAASASASANADASDDVVAQAAAQASAYSDDDASASAKATAAANAAAQVAATAQASTTATADATSAANANAAVAAQAAALAAATTNANADTSAAANANAGSAAEAAALSDASTDASVAAVGTANASATADPDAQASTDASSEVNTNASASAAASAQADDDNNAAAQAAAVAAALANADTQASAKATANANAAAQAAATAQAEASTDASTDATSETNARAAAAAQSSAEADSSQAATAQANANASAAASNAANADASVNASATAAADVNANATASAETDATTTADASASANANPDGKLGITIKVPVLERSQQQTAIGTGFAPGEVVTGVMNSDPLALGTQVANSEGTVTFTWAIPAGTDLGTHTVTLTGAVSGSVAGTFQVVATGLASTGGTAPNGWIVLGALLLMFGLGTALVARSKRETVTAE